VKNKNVLIICSFLLILYFVIGHGFIKFYLGGKTEILKAAEQINKQCNTNGSCPVSLEEWQAQTNGSARLLNENIQYHVASERGINGGDMNKKSQTFTLTYGFFIPDHWFEVQGGVGKKVTSSWKGR
jgi:hypothetical protein